MKKLIKCKLCRNKINKKEVCYFETNKICKRCFERLRWKRTSKQKPMPKFWKDLIDKYAVNI